MVQYLAEVALLVGLVRRKSRESAPVVGLDGADVELGARRGVRDGGVVGVVGDEGGVAEVEHEARDEDRG